MAAVVRGVLRGIKEKGLTNFLRDVREEGYLY
jgi:NADH dehydrogenase (ubiquinone) 1 alpha subcomplex subunit 12